MLHSYSSYIPLPPVHKHWEIYLQLYIGYNYLVFLVIAHETTRLILDEIQQLLRTNNWLNVNLILILDFMLVVQVQIERLKDVTQTCLVLVFPLADVWISRYTSIIYHVATSQSILVCCLCAHQCKISWKLHLNGKTKTSNTDLQSIMEKISESSVGQIRPIAANTMQISLD